MADPLRKLRRLRGGNENQLESIYHASRSPENYVHGFLDRFVAVMQSLDSQAISKLIERLDEACERGRQIFLMGNGGSAAVASHLAADLTSNCFVQGRQPFRAISLSDNVESITAIANDSGYENVFLHQLQSLLRPDDLVMAFSVSGNSENVIRGIQYANDVNAYTVSLTGFDGGRLAALCKLSVHISTTRDEYGPVEDLFSCIGHMVSGYLSMRRGRFLSH